MEPERELDTKMRQGHSPNRVSPESASPMQMSNGTAALTLVCFDVNALSW